MKLGYLTALAVASALTVGALSTLSPAQANPCAASPAAVNPCAANPCAANPCAANPCAAAAIAKGTFQGVDHPTQGTATIVEEDGKRYLEFDADFESDDGPDLFVLLHEEAVPQSYDSEQFVNLGELQTTAGSQRYEIPEGVSVEDFRSAVIWCRQFNVTFGFAAL